LGKNLKGCLFQRQLAKLSRLCEDCGMQRIFGQDCV